MLKWASLTVHGERVMAALLTLQQRYLRSKNVMLDQIAKHVEDDFTDETAAKVLSICRELLKERPFWL